MTDPDFSPVRRTARASFRVSRAERETLERNARAVGMSVSAYVRNLALGRPVRALPGHLRKRAIYELSKIGTNLKQLHRVAVAAGQEESRKLIEGTLESVQGALERLGG